MNVLKGDCPAESPMLEHVDQFDLALLNLVQGNASQTADALSENVPLSPSAIARRLRRLRGQGVIARTIALLSPRLVDHRLRAIVFIQLHENADTHRKAMLRARLLATKEVQFCYAITGVHDLVAMLDCPGMNRFNEVIDTVLSADMTVRRYESHFITREIKFAPFVDLIEARAIQNGRQIDPPRFNGTHAFESRRAESRSESLARRVSSSAG